MTDQNSFQKALAQYYRTRYQRSEECINDIIKILECNITETTQVTDILDRLVKHYQQH